MLCDFKWFICVLLFHPCSTDAATLSRNSPPPPQTPIDSGFHLSITTETITRAKQFFCFFFLDIVVTPIDQKHFRLASSGHSGRNTIISGSVLISILIFLVGSNYRFVIVASVSYWLIGWCKRLLFCLEIWERWKFVSEESWKSNWAFVDRWGIQNGAVILLLLLGLVFWMIGMVWRTVGCVGFLI